MKKEKLTLESIKKDFEKIVSWQIDVKSEAHLVYAIPILALAIIAGVLVHMLLGIVISLFAVYPIIRLVQRCVIMGGIAVPSLILLTGATFRFL